MSAVQDTGFVKSFRQSANLLDGKYTAGSKSIRLNDIKDIVSQILSKWINVTVMLATGY